MAQKTSEVPPAGTRLRMTYEEFLAFGEDTTHAEWVDGEVIVIGPGTVLHQELKGHLSMLVGLYVGLFDLGEMLMAPFEVRLTRSAREPDLLFVARHHVHRLTDLRVEGPVDLAIEIISDESETRDRVDKLREYAEAGVAEYWLFDPRPGKQRTEFYQLAGSGTYQAVLPDDAGHLHSTVLPGFWLDPSWLWREPSPDVLTILATIAPDAMRAKMTRKAVEGKGGTRS